MLFQAGGIYEYKKLGFREVGVSREMGKNRLHKSVFGLD